jgi:hypothetical protein
MHTSRNILTKKEENKLDKLCHTIGLNKNPTKVTNKDVILEITKEINDLEENIVDSDELQRTNSKTLFYKQMLNNNTKYTEFYFRKLKQSTFIEYDYVNKHVMYFLLTNLSGKNDKYYVIKIGYSNNVFKRITEIEYELGILCYPLYIKEIEAEYNEKFFHNSLVKKYPNYVYEEKGFPKKKDKNVLEFYYGNIQIFQLFVSFVENIICDKDKMEIEKTKQEIERTKQKEIDKEIEIEKTKQQKIDKEIEIEKTKQEIEKEKTKQQKIEFYTLLLNKNLSSDERKQLINI